MVQVVPARGIALVVRTDQNGEILVHRMRVVGAAAGHGAKFALPDEAVAEIGKERQVVSAKEGREMEFARFRQTPYIVERGFGGVGLVALARIDVVTEVGHVDGHQSRHHGSAVVSDAEQCELVAADVEHAFAIELILLAMFQPVEESVAVRGLHGEPRLGGGIGGAPTGSEVDIAVIASDGGKGLQPRAKAVDRSHIDGVVTFADVKRAAISHDSFDDLGDHDVGIRVAVAVRIGAEIVGNQEAADGEVLGDRLAMVSGHARGEVLRRLDTAGSGFDRQTGDGNRRAGAAGIGVEDLVVNVDALRRVGMIEVCFASLRGDRDRVVTGSHAAEPHVHGKRFGFGQGKGLGGRLEIAGAGAERVHPRRQLAKNEPAIGVTGGADLRRAGAAAQPQGGARNQVALRIGHLTRYAAVRGEQRRVQEQRHRR